MRRILTTIIIAALFNLSACSGSKKEESVREKESKNFPQRKDSWFKKNLVNAGDKIDPYGDLSREDYMEIADPSEKNKNLNIVTPHIQLPDVTGLMKSPDKIEVENDKLVSISVNEEIPLKEVLVELARKAEIDVEIDKNINGGIIFIAHEKPFSEVIERICKIADLRYKFTNGVLQITKDTPFVTTYKFNMLDLTRSSSSSVSANVQVGGSGGSSGGSSTGSSSGASTASITSGSTNQLDMKSGEGDMWKTLEEGVQKILDTYALEQVSLEQAQQKVQQAAGGAVKDYAILSSNRNAGIITVLANTKQHQAIKEYLDGVHISLTSQVLIEAKVMEVSLKDEFASGINWNLLTTDGGFVKGISTGANLGSTIASSSAIAADSFKFSVLPTELFGNSGNSLDASVTLLQTFGITRSLSNPRISTMNNQSAVLNFSENEVYFQVKLDDQQSTSGTAGVDNRNVSVESEIKTVPIGIILSLQPSIDLQRNEITMHIRPTLTRVTDRVADPAIAIIADRLDFPDADSLNSEIPVVEVREIDTVLRAKSSDIMVIGGLLQEKVINEDKGIPGLSSLPYLGNAFKKVGKDTQLVETVIFIKATIVPGQGVSVEDKEFYKKYSKGRHPFFNKED